jgi:hypothetical protein
LPVPGKQGPASAKKSKYAIVLHYRVVDGVEVELQHGLPRREFRSCCMMRWIFRLIVMTVAAKLVNRYLGSRHPQPRPQS